MFLEHELDSWKRCKPGPRYPVTSRRYLEMKGMEHPSSRSLQTFTQILGSIVQTEAKTSSNVHPFCVGKNDEAVAF